MAQGGVVAERRDRARHALVGDRQVAEPDERLARDRLRPDVADARRRRAVGRAAVGGERARELGEQERVAAARLVRGAHELRVGLGGEQLAQDVAGRRGAERPGADRARDRLAGDRVDELQRGVGLGRSRRQDEQHRQLVEAAGEVLRVAQRRHVGPVRVVERDEQRAVGGDPRGQPVQAVQQREQLAARRLRAGRRLRAQQLRGDPGGALEQPAARDERVGGDERLEELAHDAEREVALQRAAAGGEDAHAALGRELLGALQQRALADAGRALDERDAARPGARRIEQRRQRGDLGFALQELAPGPTGE